MSHLCPPIGLTLRPLVRNESPLFSVNQNGVLEVGIAAGRENLFDVVYQRDGRSTSDPPRSGPRQKEWE